MLEVLVSHKTVGFFVVSHSVIFDQINADVLLRKVNYLYLATVMCPIVFLYPVSA